MDVLAGVRESRDLAKKAGLPVNIMSGGSTGTYNIDHETGLTELESGTYVFMDTEYFIVGGRDGAGLKDLRPFCPCAASAPGR